MENNERKQTILVVDDMPENILVLDGILNQEYNIKAATSGGKALEIAMSENHPDLILLDIMMPGMDGLEVCRQLKSNESTRNIPVIFVTARGEIDDEFKGFELGAVDYIIKPVSPPIVKARVSAHITIHEHKRKLEEVNKVLEYKEEINNNELELSRRIQQHFISANPPISELFDFHVIYKPMRAIGGDFYNYVLRREGDIGVLIADVSGHGIPAALIMSMLKMSCLSMQKYSDKANAYLKALNDSLFNNIPTENYVTAFYGILSAADRSFTYANAGHCSPLFYRNKTKEIKELNQKGSFLGMFEDIEEYQCSKLKLEKGDKILMYTDGIIEAVNQYPEYGRKLLYASFLQNVDKGIKELVCNIYKNIKSEIDSAKDVHEDDITILGIEVK